MQIALVFRSFVRRAALAALCASAATALAVPQRTFVASYGVDSDPCTRAQPCRSFAVAVARVATGGEVVAIDSGGYGPVTIDRLVSIVAPAGIVAWINAVDQPGIKITDTGEAHLHGLRVTSEGAPRYAIDADNPVGGSRVFISHCTVSSRMGTALAIGAGGYGIVSDSSFQDSGGGVYIGGYARLERVRIHSNAFHGIVGGPAVLRDVAIFGNGGNGIDLSFRYPVLTISGSSIVQNGGHGLYLIGWTMGGDADAITSIEVSDSTIAHNAGSGLLATRYVPGDILHLNMVLSNNVLAGNGNAGASLMEGAVAGNAVVGNGAEGIHGEGSTFAFTYTRGNNAILQSTPVTGTLTPISAY